MLGLKLLLIFRIEEQKQTNKQNVSFREKKAKVASAFKQDSRCSHAGTTGKGNKKSLKLTVSLQDWHMNKRKAKTHFCTFGRQATEALLLSNPYENQVIPFPVP